MPLTYLSSAPSGLVKCFFGQVLTDTDKHGLTSVKMAFARFVLLAVAWLTDEACWQRFDC